MQKVNKLLQKQYKTQTIQTNFDVRYLDNNHKKKIQINIENIHNAINRRKGKKNTTMVETLVLHANYH